MSPDPILADPILDPPDLATAWTLFAAVALLLAGFLAFVVIVVLLRRAERRRASPSPEPGKKADGVADPWVEAGRRAPTPPGN